MRRAKGEEAGHWWKQDRDNMSALELNATQVLPTPALSHICDKVQLPPCSL